MNIYIYICRACNGFIFIYTRETIYLIILFGEEDGINLYELCYLFCTRYINFKMFDNNNKC